jgi:hypothetical protein
VKARLLTDLRGAVPDMSARPKWTGRRHRSRLCIRSERGGTSSCHPMIATPSRPCNSGLCSTACRLRAAARTGTGKLASNSPLSTLVLGIRGVENLKDGITDRLARSHLTRQEDHVCRILPSALTREQWTLGFPDSASPRRRGLYGDCRDESRGEG